MNRLTWSLAVLCVTASLAYSQEQKQNPDIVTTDKDAAIAEGHAGKIESDAALPKRDQKGQTAGSGQRQGSIDGDNFRGKRQDRERRNVVAVAIGNLTTPYTQLAASL